jgi:hypothetical protein
MAVGVRRSVSLHVERLREIAAREPPGRVLAEDEAHEIGSRLVDRDGAVGAP